MPDCKLHRLVDTPGSSATSSATAAIFSPEWLLQNLTDLTAILIVPYFSRRAAKRRSVCPVGVGRPGNLCLDSFCDNSSSKCWHQIGWFQSFFSFFFKYWCPYAWVCKANLKC